jgi:putative tryptophan/tyrosine transport system substrate-binding protein
MAFLGGAALGPFAFHERYSRKPSYRVSFLALVPGEDTSLMQPLVERLHELGYHDGKNLRFDYRSADGHPERLPDLANELVRAKPDVLVAGFGTLTTQAASAATRSIPIVFTDVGDPVGAGLVRSLSRPGGNLTGLADQGGDLQGKRLELLQELIPPNDAIAVIMNPDTPFTALALKELKAAAAARHTLLTTLKTRTSRQLLRSFETAVNVGAAGLLVFEDPFSYTFRKDISDLAAKFRLPALYGFRDFVEAGGLMSYGADRRQLYRRAAEYVDRILRGAKPEELAVEQPTRFEFLLNLTAATAPGIDIPPTLLARADEVIE